MLANVTHSGYFLGNKKTEIKTINCNYTPQKGQETHSKTTLENSDTKQKWGGIHNTLVAPKPAMLKI